MVKIQLDDIASATAGDKWKQSMLSAETCAQQKVPAIARTHCY